MNLPSDSQILRSEVSPEQVADLELRLVAAFFERAKREGKRVVFESDARRYLERRDLGEVFDGPEYVLLADDERAIIDMAPVVYHCLGQGSEEECEVARVYGKIMLQRGCLLPSVRPGPV